MIIQEKKTKSALSEEVWTRIRGILDERKFSQIELARLCEAYGYKVSQPEISKLYSGKIQLTLYQLAAFSDVLGISADYLINEKEVFRRFQVEGQSFAVQPSEDAFNGYLGTYFVIFHSTSAFEDKVLNGKLTCTPSEKNDICEVLFQLDTGEKDMTGKPHVKIYKGQLIISRKMGVAYCILANERIGEICMIEFRHRSFLVKQAECRLGLSLSVSSGESKVPIVNKMFLSRNPISKELQKKILPFLKVESEEILVRTSEIMDLVANSGLDFDFHSLVDKCDVDEYVLIDEKSIRKINRKLSRYDMAQVMCLLKEKSVGEYTVKVSEQDDEQTFDIVRGMDES